VAAADRRAARQVRSVLRWIAASQSPDFGCLSFVVSYTFLSMCAGDPGMVQRKKDICGPGVKPSDLMPAIPTQPISCQDASFVAVSVV
jgi:hypothetical protein